MVEKITTFRRLAEEALERLAPWLTGDRATEGWTAKASLPGGDFDVYGFAALAEKLQRDYPFLNAGHARRLAHAYGNRAAMVLGNATSSDDLGRDFGGTLTKAK